MLRRSIPKRKSKTDATGEGAAVYLSCQGAQALINVG